MGQICSSMVFSRREKGIPYYTSDVAQVGSGTDKSCNGTDSTRKTNPPSRSAGVQLEILNLNPAEDLVGHNGHNEREDTENGESERYLLYFLYVRGLSLMLITDFLPDMLLMPTLRLLRHPGQKQFKILYIKKHMLIFRVSLSSTTTTTI